jgi:Cd2+/Zn2+-exporting ATPase/Cu+-exporting ATPase
VAAALEKQARVLEASGKTAVFVARDGGAVGVIAVADAPRPGVAAALADLRALGARQITMLTGDNPRVAATIAGDLGVEFQAELMPEDKITAVRRLQAEGRTVAMIGDGINDAPALSQADVGIAVGTATAAALEAADVVLLKDDWRLVPEAVRTGRRAFGIIRQNLIGTVAYNVFGIVLAMLGLLPPVLAASAQVIPDLLILLNAGRLLRARPVR